MIEGEPFRVKSLRDLVQYKLKQPQKIVKIWAIFGEYLAILGVVLNKLIINIFPTYAESNYQNSYRTCDLFPRREALTWILSEDCTALSMSCVPVFGD